MRGATTTVKKNPLTRKRSATSPKNTESIQLAKDIRIFGLGPWLSDIYESTLRLYDAFINRRGADLHRRLRGGCSAQPGPQRYRLRLLDLAYPDRRTARQPVPALFSAFTGFSTWVTGILQECSTLHKESLTFPPSRNICICPSHSILRTALPFPGGPVRAAAGPCHLPLSRHKKAILQDLCLTIRPGEKVAVVGLNGAGKTTLVKLLCGFYDPDEGRVLLNGQDIGNSTAGLITSCSPPSFRRVPSWTSPLPRQWPRGWTASTWTK